MLFFSTAGAIGCYNHENMTTRVKPLYYDCGCLNAANDSNYGNRMGLASKLMENISASQDNFFASYTVGSVFGFVLCRGDYNGSNCADRLNQTIKDYISVTDTNQMICPSSMDVTIYYDQHMVSFFSGGGDGEEYKGLGSNMPAWVASNMNYVMNSTGAAGFYGERVPEKFTTPAGDHCVGGRILGVWCNLRFETELFFEVTQETRKLHKPKSQLSKVNITLITIAGFVVFVRCLNLIGAIIRRIRDRKLQRELGEWHNEVMREIDSRFSLYHFTMIRDATRNFSEENELGLGSFSFVHRGILPDGLEIAVKRLDASSWQGSTEFLNEIKLIVKLQHANLVRLLGCCLQRNEMILVYEYLPNRSLDYVFSGPFARFNNGSPPEINDVLLYFKLFISCIILSDPASRGSLNWSTRLRIIDGIAQGLVYLHNFSEPQKFIVHRDMKLSNILLDSEMNPKISDFGISRIYDLGAIEPEPTDVVGTHGYMAPEYMRERILSVKYDVFSFGVLLPEIISGRRVNVAVFTDYGRSDHLLTHAWHIWRGEKYNQLVDPSLRGVYQMLELRRRIQIALLCIQENLDARPHMREVSTMLSNNDVSLPVPQPPAYFNLQLGMLKHLHQTTMALCFTLLGPIKCHRITQMNSI
ncbi:hypothetical protein HU200_036301 [Digitaria exilis]|uniref:Protein kinase domain-containing protein n=1 Tax=Digitaria exilis TaxID=1010633 RepID=A0A835BRY5_9POAL|nr:hypothetical protein HU200_036301 [Digitaria exilis]